METLLNLLWIAVSAGLFIAIRPRTRQVQIALLLAAVLLFPIISVSDDLNADRAMNDAALVIPLLTLLAALVAIACIETLSPSRRLILLAVQSDPRSPPRR
jgi:hypothetical protein